MEERLDTRRALVGGAAAGSLLLLLGGGRRVAHAQIGQDRQIVDGLVELEADALALYEDGAAAVGGEAATTMRRFAEQQREHVETLDAVVGGDSSNAIVDVPAGRQAILEAAVAAEDRLVAAYLDAHQRLQDSALVTLGAGIMANHGQHLVGLRDLLGEDLLVPDAFATGG